MRTVVADHPGGPAAVAVADLNGDGALDLVSANDTGDPATSRLRIFYQPASGWEDGATAELELGNRGTSVVAADVDGDGKPDLVSGREKNNRVVIFFQTGERTFTVPPVRLGNNATTFRPRSVAVADLDEDGDLDLVSANSDTDDLTIFLQSSPGRFATLPDLVLGGPELEGGPVSIVAADLNSDGELDLASALRRDDVSFGNAFDGILVFLGGK